jgi:membrane-associated phospholipid phosphatase
MTDPALISEWIKHWLYDWGGANIVLFLDINRALPEQMLWLPQFLSWAGSFWGAPVVAALLLLWQRRQPVDSAVRVRQALSTFLLGVTLALLVAAVAKEAFAFPRPSSVLGDAVFHVMGLPDSRYTLPSGHAVYVAALLASVWPLVAWPGRALLFAFALAVGWSRVALGMHFPADVVGGFALGWVCLVAASVAVRRLTLRRLPGRAAR